MNNKNTKLSLESTTQTNESIVAVKKNKIKNLSPAKKFRLRLRRAKFQKQQQAKEDYFEHDNRDAKISPTSLLTENKNKLGRLNKKGRRAQMYIDAYLKSQKKNLLGDTASQDDTQDSSNGNFQRLNRIELLPPMISFKNNQNIGGKLQEMYKTTTTNTKCCCHCACSSNKKKARKKLSSPYFGDFKRVLNMTDSNNCSREARVTTKILNQTTTTHETLVKADSVNFINKNKLTLNSLAKITRKLGNNSYLQCQRDNRNGFIQVPNFIRFVLKL